MIVFYTASFWGKDKYQENYDLVRQTIKRFKVKLISPEEGNYQEVLKPRLRKRYEQNPEMVHYEAIKEGIHLSDVLIIEVSYQDIQLGHEISLALSDKKPVLCLSVYEDMSRKIRHPFLFGAKYTPDNLEATIQNFLARVRELKLARRFNMFLYPYQIEYLESAAKKSGVAVSEYIRKLINMDKSNSESS